MRNQRDGISAIEFDLVRDPKIGLKSSAKIRFEGR